MDQGTNRDNKQIQAKGMKQGRAVYVALSVICVLGLLAYIGYYVYQAAENSLQTAYAVDFEAYDSFSVSGIIVRDEQVLYSNQPLISITRREGEKVGKNQTVALSFKTEAARERRNEIEDLEVRIAQLESTAGATIEVLDGVKLDEAITSAILTMNKSVSSRSLSAIDRETASLQNLIFNREYTYSEISQLETEINQLSSKLSSLNTESDYDTSKITTPASGIYSAYVDGYESVLTTAILADMTIADFNSLSPNAQDTDSAIGKVITNTRWYLVATMPHDRAKQLGKTVKVRFSQEFSADLDMDVDSVGPAQDGVCLVVMSSDQHLSDMTLLRRQKVDIIMTSYSGIRVPKRAIHFDADGNTGVYCLEGLNASFKVVDIIYETGEFYIVKNDRSSASKLWPGSEVIINGKELFDGKVVVK